MKVKTTSRIQTRSKCHCATSTCSQQARGACVSARGRKQEAFNAVNRGNGSDVKFVKDEDSQQ
ncbi:hypothetical protein HN873_060291, partial [Arachis hypogaea]